jgi:DNA replicative helicase MCM subunit Mcm2 (Cdc46/Mcm family)
MPLNLPRFTEFPGHDVEEHEEFFAKQREASLELDVPAERIHDAPQARENGYTPGQESVYLDDDLVAFFNEDETVNVDDTVTSQYMRWAHNALIVIETYDSSGC